MDDDEVVVEEEDEESQTFQSPEGAISSRFSKRTSEAIEGENKEARSEGRKGGDEWVRESL